MKALVFKEAHQPLFFGEVDHPKEKDNCAIVKIKAAALNHRDNWIMKGLYPGLTPGVIVGSDGCGIHNGNEVVINPNVNWGNNAKLFGSNYTILGMPSHGTFAEYISIEENKIFDKPRHLSTEQGAALPLGGLTAYRAFICKCKPQKGETVLISGIGGGVALFAFQYALALGCRVFVTSGSDDKIAKAINLGAIGGANYNNDKWQKSFLKEHGGVDVIIDSAGGDGFKNLTYVANPGGRIALYGGTTGNLNNISSQLVFWKQLEIYGSTMGNDQEFADMISFVEKHKIIPIVDKVFDLKDGNKAIEYMNDRKQFGKIVLKVV